VYLVIPNTNPYRSGVAAQVTLTPTTICRGPTCTTCPVTETHTQTTTKTATETFVSVKTTTTTDTVTKTNIVYQTTTQTTTYTTTKPCVSCPSVTSTGTICRSCLVAGCTTTSILKKPAGCDTLPTATVSFPCDRADVCNQIGCRTVYAIQTA